MCNCIEEAKKMIEEETYDLNDARAWKSIALEELIERLEKLPEQSRYEIAINLLDEYFEEEKQSGVGCDFRTWLNFKQEILLEDKKNYERHSSLIKYIKTLN